MIPVYCIGDAIEREEAWRWLASGAGSREEKVAIARAIREWDDVVAMLRRPGVNDNERRFQPC